MINGLSFRITAPALALEPSIADLFSRFVTFCEFFGTVERATSGHHINNEKNPHWHFHVQLSGTPWPLLPPTALKAPLEWWRKQTKKSVSAGLPTAPLGSGRQVLSIKYHDPLTDETRYHQYPLKELTVSRLTQEKAELLEYSINVTPEEFDTMAHRANGEYTVHLNNARRDSEAKERRTATQNALYDYLDSTKLRGYLPLMDALCEHYLEVHDDIPQTHSAQKMLLAYMLKRKHMTVRQWSRMTLPKGLPNELLMQNRSLDDQRSEAISNIEELRQQLPDPSDPRYPELSKRLTMAMLAEAQL